MCKWSTESWTVDKVRKVGDRGVTCFDVRCVIVNRRVIGGFANGYAYVFDVVRMANCWDLGLPIIRLGCWMRIRLVYVSLPTFLCLLV